MKFLIWVILIFSTKNVNKMYKNIINNKNYPFNGSQKYNDATYKYNKYNGYFYLKIIKLNFNYLRNLFLLNNELKRNKNDNTNHGIKNIEENNKNKLDILILKRNLRKLSIFLKKFNKYKIKVQKNFKNLFIFYWKNIDLKVIKNFNFILIDNQKSLKYYYNLNSKAKNYYKLLNKKLYDLKKNNLLIKKEFIKYKDINLYFKNSILINNEKYERIKNVYIRINILKDNWNNLLNSIINILGNLITQKFKVQKLYDQIKSEKNYNIIDYKNKLELRNDILKKYGENIFKFVKLNALLYFIVLLMIFN